MRQFIHSQYARKYVRIIIVCGLMMISGLYYGSTVVSTWLHVISADLGISRSAFSAFTMFRCLVAFALNLKITFFLRKIGLRRMVLAGSCASALVMLALAGSYSLSGVILAGILSGISFSFSTVAPVSMIISNWFRYARATVLSLVVSFSGLAGVAMSPVISRFITLYGWRTGFRLLAGTAFAMLAAELLLMRVTPEEAGAVPYGDGAGENGPEETRSTSSASGSGNRETGLRPDNLILMILLVVLFNLGAATVYGNISAALIGYGYAETFVTGGIMSLLSLTNVLGKLAVGRACDRMGVNRTLLLWYCAAAAAVLRLLLLRGDAAGACIGVAALGMIAGLYTVVVPVLCDLLFPAREQYDLAVGYGTAASCISTAFSVTIFQGLYEAAGSYRASMLFCVVLAVICPVVFCILVARNRAAFRRQARQ